ncbi:MAG: hypothetical protein ACI81Q_001389 [Paracoccaceae bacterium]|jgi:hypothetical protein
MKTPAETAMHKLYTSHTPLMHTLMISRVKGGADMETQLALADGG